MKTRSTRAAGRSGGVADGAVAAPVRLRRPSTPAAKPPVLNPCWSCGRGGAQKRPASYGVDGVEPMLCATCASTCAAVLSAPTNDAAIDVILGHYSRRGR